jgi:hypothetical protein
VSPIIAGDTSLTVTPSFANFAAKFFIMPVRPALLAA